MNTSEDTMTGVGAASSTKLIVFALSLPSSKRISRTMSSAIALWRKVAELSEAPLLCMFLPTTFAAMLVCWRVQPKLLLICRFATRHDGGNLQNII